MAEYIEREAVLNWFEPYLGAGETWVEIHPVLDAVHMMPAADVVPVVRCKDCKHRKNWKDEITWHCGNPEYGMATAVELQDDDFCSYGERRGDTNG